MNHKVGHLHKYHFDALQQRIAPKKGMSSLFKWFYQVFCLAICTVSRSQVLSSFQQKRLDVLAAGLKGFLITCNEKNGHVIVSEAYRLLNEVML